MYSYCFTFYKPGSTYFREGQIRDMLGKFLSVGIKFRYSFNDPHVKERRTLVFDHKEEFMNITLEKGVHCLDFHLHPAEGHLGRVGGIFMAEEEFKADPTKNSDFIYEAAAVIFSGIKPYFAWGDHELEIDKLETSLSFDKVGALAWANLFSREFVEKMGGLDKVLVHPQEESGYYQKRAWEFAYVGTSSTPLEAMSALNVIEYERRYPEALFRGFEVPALSAIEAE